MHTFVVNHHSETQLPGIIIKIASSSFLVIAMTLFSDICQIKENKK